MAAGLPVVATTIPGYAAVARDGIDGVLVPPGDAGALADALCALLQDRARIEALGAQARERARRYDWSAVGAEIEEAYNDALKPRKEPAL